MEEVSDGPLARELADHVDGEERCTHKRNKFVRGNAEESTRAQDGGKCAKLLLRWCVVLVVGLGGVSVSGGVGGDGSVGSGVGSSRSSSWSETSSSDVDSSTRCKWC